MNLVFPSLSRVSKEVNRPGSFATFASVRAYNSGLGFFFMNLLIMIGAKYILLGLNEVPFQSKAASILALTSCYPVG